MPFGAGFVIAFVVFPDFLGCDVEDDVLAIVLSGFGFCVLFEAARFMLTKQQDGHLIVNFAEGLST
jgi:hypothetical protein